MGRLQDKVAVITGATSGIGRACAIRFAEEGARVVIAGRRRDLGEAVAKAIGDAAAFIACDVTREADIAALIDQAGARFGRIDCVVSNAGAGSGTSGITETDAAALDQDFVLHVRAPFLAMKLAAPGMIARGDGSFINMSSLSAHRAGFNTFGYEVAKAALVHLTRCAAIELGEHGVRANSISPGPTMTDIFAKHTGGSADARTRIEAAFAQALPQLQALPGMVQAEDVANTALFLASDEARFVNGQDVIVDGGIAAGRPASVMKAGWAALAEAARAP
jgi:NAD(P)-dependent dehydrogenase (short-subunit alcohol dehydrogenase family)